MSACTCKCFNPSACFVFNLRRQILTTAPCKQARRAAVCCAAPNSGGSRSTSSKPVNSQKDNPLALAFLGDAIWTLYVRRHFFTPPKHYSLYHAAVRPFITAEGQAAVYDTLLGSKQFSLTPDEVALLRRVRAWENVKLRKRFSTPAAADIYRKATALEALVGHLHLHDPQRLEQLVTAVLPPSPSISTSPGQTQDIDEA